MHRSRAVELGVVAALILFAGCGRSRNYPQPSPSNYDEVRLVIRLDGRPREIQGAKVERPFFETAGVAPLLGRTFSDAEYRSADAPAVVVGERFWRAAMGGDTSRLGTSIELNAKPHTVVGVMPAFFDSPPGASLWLAGPPPPTLFRDVRVFDGERVIAVATVVLRNGRIAQVAAPGQTVQIPADAEIVDGSGKTLLPGLIDAHTHTFYRSHLKTATGFGVTTHLDMGTDLGVMRALKDEQDAGVAADRADLFSAGTLVTAPGGHGTQYGVVIPTLSGPTEAQTFVDARIAEGSDYIKIVYEDGRAYGTAFPTFDEPTLRAAIRAARTRDKMAVVHVGSYELARTAIEAGANGLVHVFADQRPDTDFGRVVAERGAFVIPTLAVMENVAGRSGWASLLRDPVIGPRLSPAAVANLRAVDSMVSTSPDLPGVPSRISMEAAFEAVRLLRQAGVPLLAGTDAPNPGTTHGASLHRELELLVEAGLTPVEALAAATSVAADAFGLGDRGRIVPGKRADVVLVEGDPSSDILATRAVAGIWKEGRRWKLELSFQQTGELPAGIGRDPLRSPP